MTPGLMAQRNLFELAVGELEIILVQVAGGLEAPGRCANEFLVEPFLLHLFVEEVNPGLNYIGAYIQVLQRYKRFLVNF